MSLSKSETNRVAIPAGRLLLLKGNLEAISKNSAGDQRTARSHLTFSDRSDSAY
jgi:hypothetical protein